MNDRNFEIYFTGFASLVDFLRQIMLLFHNNIRNGTITTQVPAKTVKHHPTPMLSIIGSSVTSPIPAKAQRIKLFDAAAVDGASLFRSIKRVLRI
jgi:hypothetical protein